MVKEFEIYHGIVFTRLTHAFGEIKISSNFNQDNSSYVINDSFGIYIKYSKKRITPWQFTFTYDHDSSIRKLYNRYNKGYIVLVCNMDGICCIKFDEYFQLISDIEKDKTKSISISRMKNEQYQVTGTDGILKYKVSDGYIES